LLCAQALEGPRAEIPERRIAPLPVVEDLDVLEQLDAESARVAQVASCTSSTLSVAKKLSATALCPNN
jgi:hypothetical protein